MLNIEFISWVRQDFVQKEISQVNQFYNSHR